MRRHLSWITAVSTLTVAITGSLYLFADALGYVDHPMPKLGHLSSLTVESIDPEEQICHLEDDHQISNALASLRSIDNKSWRKSYFVSLVPPDFVIRAGTSELWVYPEWAVVSFQNGPWVPLYIRDIRWDHSKFIYEICGNTIKTSRILVSDQQ